MDANSPGEIDLYETPLYLRDVEPLDEELLDLIEQSELRDLSPRELFALELGLMAARRRVRIARRDRDGKD